MCVLKEAVQFNGSLFSIRDKGTKACAFNSTLIIIYFQSFTFLEMEIGQKSNHSSRIIDFKELNYDFYVVVQMYLC